MSYFPNSDASTLQWGGPQPAVLNTPTQKIGVQSDPSSQDDVEAEALRQLQAFKAGGQQNSSWYKDNAAKGIWSQIANAASPWAVGMAQDGMPGGYSAADDARSAQWYKQNTTPGGGATGLKPGEFGGVTSGGSAPPSSQAGGGSLGLKPSEFAGSPSSLAWSPPGPPGGPGVASAAPAATAPNGRVLGDSVGTGRGQLAYDLPGERFNTGDVRVLNTPVQKVGIPPAGVQYATDQNGDKHAMVQDGRGGWKLAGSPLQDNFGTPTQPWMFDSNGQMTQAGINRFMATSIQNAQLVKRQRETGYSNVPTLDELTAKLGGHNFGFGVDPRITQQAAALQQQQLAAAQGQSKLETERQKVMGELDIEKQKTDYTTGGQARNDAILLQNPFMTKEDIDNLNRNRGRMQTGTGPQAGTAGTPGSNRPGPTPPPSQDSFEKTLPGNNLRDEIKDVHTQFAGRKDPRTGADIKGLENGDPGKFLMAAYTKNPEYFRQNLPEILNLAGSLPGGQQAVESFLGRKNGRSWLDNFTSFGGLLGYSPEVNLASAIRNQLGQPQPVPWPRAVIDFLGSWDKSMQPIASPMKLY